MELYLASKKKRPQWDLKIANSQNIRLGGVSVHTIAFQKENNFVLQKVRSL